MTCKIPLTHLNQWRVCLGYLNFCKEVQVQANGQFKLCTVTVYGVHCGVLAQYSITRQTPTATLGLQHYPLRSCFSEFLSSIFRVHLFGGGEENEKRRILMRRLELRFNTKMHTRRFTESGKFYKISMVRLAYIRIRKIYA